MKDLIADNRYKLAVMNGAEKRDGANDLGAIKGKITQGLNYPFPCTPSGTSVQRWCCCKLRQNLALFLEADFFWAVCRESQ